MKQLQRYFLSFAVVSGVISEMAQAQSFDSASIAALVGKQVVTHYDVSQRAKKFAIERGGKEADHREGALEELITEMTWRTAAVKAGYSVNKIDIDRRLAEFARSQNTSPAKIMAFYKSKGVATLSVRNFLENQLLREKYVLRLFRKKSERSITLDSVKSELGRYEQEQLVELKLHQVAFDQQKVSDSQEVRRTRSHIIQKMKDDGMSFADIGAKLSSKFSGISYRDLGWQREQAFRDSRLINLMASLPAGSVTQPIRLSNNRGISLFFIQQKRVRTYSGVEPFRFNGAILLVRSSSETTNEQLKASIETLKAFRNPDFACNENAALPAGLERHFRRGVSIENMSLQNRSVTLALNVGQFSKISISDKRKSGKGAVVSRFVLCGRSGGFKSDAAKKAAGKIVRNKLVNAKIALLAKKHILELRQRTYVEIL